MQPITIDIAETVALGTQVAIAGAMRATDGGSDQIFEYIIAVAILVYEMVPG